MPTHMDALGAFTYLADNLPSWISRLADLTAHTSAKHAEFADAYKKHSTPSKPRRRRNSSVCSIQTDSLTGSRSRSRSHSKGVKRRRGSDDGSPDSRDADGAAIVSTRHSLIIHYDGYTQKTLEEMVRNIGTARNNLRKGKIAQIPLGLGAGRRSLQPRSAARALLPAVDSDIPEGDLLASIRATRNRGPPTPQVAARQSPFDLADKNLELAHSFCETAAYHFLRAGGCASELESVKQRFTVLLKLATEEVQRLQEEKKEQAGKEGMVGKEAEPKDTATVTVTETTVSLKRPASSEGPIEVDDEQASVESIDLTAFRVGRFRR
ncbi:uncharacterized protein DSM5745_08410 [Aspergillus mulundensis]|uniref:Uncharacterized protein n=1 Tax=Aspergillus mulundensis TaxID=1810919 RepID=A0A3D8RA22_9EURO|nr:Uncharacterized protein DSM5745_08410 [Aspergillus mulundensis]RDW70899.1 Uncharacterized protein DSM5745_08410 [Aspergillus mulundensis]